jgi:hypothetical protein
VVTLDAITPEEFVKAFARWPASLTHVEADDLAKAVYEAIAPSVMAHSGGQGGYQAVKFTLKPQKVASDLRGAGYRASQASPPENTIEPMPCLFA